ncbi:MAG: hypothetical protein ACE5F1_00975 [Planctomycetota bacterium]
MRLRSRLMRLRRWIRLLWRDVRWLLPWGISRPPGMGPGKRGQRAATWSEPLAFELPAQAESGNGAVIAPLDPRYFDFQVTNAIRRACCMMWTRHGIHAMEGDFRVPRESDLVVAPDVAFQVGFVRWEGEV